MAKEPDPKPKPNVIIEAAQMAGVWANWARVHHSPFEFTLDFVRLDFSSAPPEGIVVARVSVSPLFVTQLIDALSENWSKYAAKAMPQEARDDPSSGSAEGSQNK